MQIGGLVHYGWTSISGMTGLCPSRTKLPMGQSRWGFMCLVGWGWDGWGVGVGGWVAGGGLGNGGVGGGGVRVGRGLVEGRGSVKWGGDKESWAYTGLEDGWRMEGARGGDIEWQDQCRRWTGNQNGRCSLQGVSLEGSRRPMPGWRGEGGRREYSDWLREEANGWLL